MILVLDTAKPTEWEMPRMHLSEVAVTVAIFFGHAVVDSFEELPADFRNAWSQAARIGYFNGCRHMSEYQNRFCDYIKG